MFEVIVHLASGIDLHSASTAFFMLHRHPQSDFKHTTFLSELRLCVRMDLPIIKVNSPSCAYRQPYGACTALLILHGKPCLGVKLGSCRNACVDK